MYRYRIIFVPLAYYDPCSREEKMVTVAHFYLSVVLFKFKIDKLFSNILVLYRTPSSVIFAAGQDQNPCLKLMRVRIRHTGF